MVDFISWLERHMQACFYKKYFGIDCPGCGMQRSFIELLKGNFIESFKLYPALFPIILMIIFLFIHVKFQFRNGANILKWMFFLNLGIIIANYIFKITNGSCYH